MIATYSIPTKLKHAGGRPPKYATAEAMQSVIDGYFFKCDILGRPYTMAGLALALDMSRMTLINYKNRNEEFRWIVNRARTRVEHSLEVILLSGTRGQVRGAIFCLKVNFGWHS